MKRYEKFVLEAEKGIKFEVFEGINGEVVIRALNIPPIPTNVYCEQCRGLKIATANVYSEHYDKPPIPEGYKYVCGEWNNGFVIERVTDGSQFVWVPVGSLLPDGSLCCESFGEKFGRRNFASKRNRFPDNEEYFEDSTAELIEQLKSVKKYGGFYISRYNISKSSDGKPQSVKGAMPWIPTTVDEAINVAAKFEKSKFVKSHLTMGVEYDSILAWLLQYGTKDLLEIIYDSSSWGNYYTSENTSELIAETGSCEEWCVNNIYDLAGNVHEWTQEKTKFVRNERNMEFYIFRGGSVKTRSRGSSVHVRCPNMPGYFDDTSAVGFRIALYIE